jgi:pimeloyl-ACP methyl ester carboxylesterase
MPTATIDGIVTRYEVLGSGPPLLMFAPAGFDASMDKWRTTGVYARVKPLDHLPKKYSCIIFDRRETGGSGGRVERLSWAHFVAQGKGLLDHLGHKRAHLMGGCMGCAPVMAFAVMYPEMVKSMVLHWPVGGAKYRLRTHQRFVQHLAYVHEQGLEKVVALVRETGKSFSEDPRGGLWAPVIRNDPAFADAYAKQNVDQYKLIVTAIARTMFDRDTAPGAEPEDLMRLNIPALIVPGRDEAHATSAARYVEECLRKSEYWDVLPAEQTEATAPPRILGFLDGVEAG